MSTVIRGTDNSVSAPAVTGTDSDTGLYFPAANQLALATNGTQAMFVDASQNVGINNGSPGSKLDVKGTLRLSGATSGYVGLAPAAAAGSTTYTLPSADGTSGQYLQTNGSGVLSFATVSAGTPTTNTYDTGTAATWTKPSSANFVLIEMWGGGSSGGKGRSALPGGGGAGGAYNYVLVKFSDLQGAVTYTVGAGGTAITTADTNGNAGGTSSVSMATYAGGGTLTVSAYGGGVAGGTNGVCGCASNNGAGGGGALSAGGSASAVGRGGAPGGVNALAASSFQPGSAGFGGGSGGVQTGTGNGGAGGNTYYGGAGGGGTTGNNTPTTTAINKGGDSVYSGAGGGGGSRDTRAGDGGTSIFGGNGGAGAFDANNATAGTAPAGGGGGSETGNSGAGAAGRVKFTYW